MASTAARLLLVLVVMAASVLSLQGQEIRFKVKEEQPAGTLVGSLADNDWLQAAVSDDGRPSLRYTFLSTGLSHADFFTINVTSGDIRTARPLDREALCGLYSPACHMTLEVAAQSALTQFFRMATVVVEVEDVNDHAPQFPAERVRLDVLEDVLMNSSLALAAAEDQDMGVYGVQAYSLVGDSAGTVFVLNVAEAPDGRQKVSLLVKGPLDREKVSYYYLTVVARDGGRPPRSGTMTVEINVLDVNDNPPVFHPSRFNISVDENTPVNSVVLTFNTTDADRTANGQKMFRFSPLMQPEVTRYFHLNASSGQLRVIAPLSEIQGRSFQMTVECSDGGHPALVGEAVVEVHVADSGNTRPRAILTLLFEGFVSEYAQPGTVVAHVRVVDPDQGLQGLVRCSVISEAMELQALDVDQYKVIVIQALDREKQATHNVTVTCRDAGSPPLSTSLQFTVHVVDVNDNPPRFDSDVYYASIVENNEIGLQITRVAAHDPDVGDNAKIDYSVASSNGDAGVIIDNNGYIIATRSFDHERDHQVTFEVLATDNGNPKRRATATVILTVQDVNDVTPKFQQKGYEIRVMENSVVGMAVGKVTADDTDSGDNGRVTYALAWENPQESAFYSPLDNTIPIAVSSDGTLTLERKLDHEQTAQYRLLVLATDNGKPARTGSARVTLIVDDVNDNAPQIIVPDPTNISALALATDTKPGSTLLVVVARDIDHPGVSQLHFHLAKATPFVRINGENGVLTLSRALNFKDVGQHRVTVVVTDSGMPPRASNASFDLMVFAANASDGPPQRERMEHLLIVIILGCVTGVITVAVIVTIVVIRRADQQRRKYSERHDVKPVSEKAAVELDSALVVINTSPDTTMTKGHDGNQGSGKEAGFEDDSLPDKSVSTYYFLLQPDDGTSDTSGESTACDSGRGGSEEDSHSNGRASPPPPSDLRVPPGSKVPRHSTFHPAGVSRTLRSNPPLSRHNIYSNQPSALASSGHSSWTDNGNPVKKVSFHDDVTRGQASSPFRGHVDRWQSPVLIGGVTVDSVPPPPPSQFHPLSGGHHIYGNQKGRHYGNLSPRSDLDTSVDTADDSASTTTSGSYCVELEPLPPKVRMPRAGNDHQAVV
ncbi:protocadherin gamma-C4-like isoform X3 [Pomacea canaliculata]|uniref:protocadherin gamma-C4-like isoform X3 n=1 Tax=Pomacea canaliculata TaxID=400727 RepID=UPI000D7261D5|nr:protocadherin gamma-C4-like isoform X3 [Pomacea canaliculata]